MELLYRRIGDGGVDSPGVVPPVTPLEQPWDRLDRIELKLDEVLKILKFRRLPWWKWLWRWIIGKTDD
jgi:hypothetical protein